VATEGLAQGQTILDRRPFIEYPQSGWSLNQPQTQVCMEVNAPACLQLFEETMLTGWLAR
jgi:inosine-uridine nucleoside N-ribohydrolase